MTEPERRVGVVDEQLEPEPAPVDPAVADLIKRQDSDAAGWYRGLPYKGRP